MSHASAPVRGSVAAGAGPSRVMGSVSDPAGDSDLSANGTRTPTGDNLDLLGASLANGPGNTIVATIHVKSLASLAASPGEGGPDAPLDCHRTDRLLG